MSETSQLEDLLDRLESLVDRERQVLLEGRLDQIAQLVSEKSLLIEALRDTIPETAERIAPLQLKMRRNQELFDHALAGIRVVSDRLT
ncbi:MAG TPA: flagellar protein FlgN, partial [Citreicella sp.]|nr:flagellar protein FlgN [Citreicella sp.]